MRFCKQIKTKIISNLILLKITMIFSISISDMEDPYELVLTTDERFSDEERGDSDEDEVQEEHNEPEKVLETPAQQTFRVSTHRNRVPMAGLK